MRAKIWDKLVFDKYVRKESMSPTNELFPQNFQKAPDCNPEVFKIIEDINDIHI